MNYKKLDFNTSIGSTSFRGMLTDAQIAKSAKGRISLQSEQIKALIAEIYTYGLFYPQEPEDRRPDLLIEISKDEIKLLKYVKQFSHHLLNNLDTQASSDFEELQYYTYDIENVLNNEELLDFVSFSLLDETHAFRHSELGMFMLKSISVSEIDKSILKSIKNGFEISKLKYSDQFVKVAEKLDKSLVLNSTDKIFICGIIRNEVRPHEMTNFDYSKFGVLMLYHLKEISAKIHTINSEMTLLKQARIYRNRKGKGRKL